MNSHAYALKLKQLSDFILSKPEFNTDYEEALSYFGMYYGNKKDDFIHAVKSLGSGKKEWSDDRVLYTPDGTDMLRLNVNRKAVCRLVKEAVYDCEPLLSQAEEAEIGV